MQNFVVMPVLSAWNGRDRKHIHRTTRQCFSLKFLTWMLRSTPLVRTGSSRENLGGLFSTIRRRTTSCFFRVDRDRRIPMLRRDRHISQYPQFYEHNSETGGAYHHLSGTEGRSGLQMRLRGILAAHWMVHDSEGGLWELRRGRKCVSYLEVSYFGHLFLVSSSSAALTLVPAQGIAPRAWERR